MEMTLDVGNTDVGDVEGRLSEMETCRMAHFIRHMHSECKTLGVPIAFSKAEGEKPEISVRLPPGWRSPERDWEERRAALIEREETMCNIRKGAKGSKKKKGKR